MAFAEKIIGKIERTTLGLTALATDLNHTTELVREQTQLLCCIAIVEFLMQLD
jgi:hypothetical protein